MAHVAISTVRVNIISAIKFLEMNILVDSNEAFVAWINISPMNKTF